MKYLFSSKRLGFRNWKDTDLDQLTTLNSSESVMKYFPNTTNTRENSEFIKRMQKMFIEKNYCYFVVEQIDTNEFLGFIGLAYQDYDSEFNPSIDIGWRIREEFWGKGIATEGAMRVLEYAKKELLLKEVVSIAPTINKGSINIMSKIGMNHKYNFNHPKLKGFKDLESCSLYSISF